MALTPAPILVSLVAAALLVSGCGASDDSGTAAPTRGSAEDYTGGLEPIAATDILSAMEQGMSWCTNYRASDGSCTIVQTFNRRTADGVVFRLLIGAPAQSKIVADIPAQIEDGRLCITQNRDTWESASAYYTSDDRGTITPSDQRVEEQVNTELRASFRADQPENERHCWEYFRSDAPSQGLSEEVLMGHYIDGVLQPFDREEDRGILVNNTNNRLAIREDM